MKAQLEEIIRKSVEGEAWHGPSVRESIAGLSAAHADLRVLPSGHTIHELVLHIAAWMDEATERVQGRRHDDPLPGNFPPPVDWQRTQLVLGEKLEKLLATMQEPGVDTHFELLTGVAQHNAYHAGQIVTMRKLIA